MRPSFALFLFVALASPALSAPPERTHDVTPADYASINTITELAVSPDGKQVAYCLATWDKKADNRRTELWVVGTDGKGKPKQLTTDRANDQHPKWSTDGKSIYVLAMRKKGDGKKPPFDGKPQVWKIPTAGGEPVAVTEVTGGVVAYDYAPKADSVFYSVDASTTDEDEFSALRKKFNKPEYGHGKRAVSEVFRIDAGAEAKKVIAEKRYVREFAVTQDGKRVAMISAIDDTVLKSEGESRVDVWEDGKVVTPPTDVYRKKAASPHAWLESLAWSPDGKQFAFCAVFDAYPTEIITGRIKDGEWSVKMVRRSSEYSIRGYGSPIKWVQSMPGSAEESGLFILGETQGYVLPCLTSTGFTSDPGIFVPPVEPGHRYCYAFDFGKDFTDLIHLSAAPGAFPELYVGMTRKMIPLTDLNPQTATWKLPTVKHVTWKAPDGTTVGGPLELPYGYKKGDMKLPLVVAIHGGPTTASYNDLRFDPHNGRLYFAAKGYAVLCPNYRGSTGYGDKFVTDLIGNENDVEVKDILAGIQHLIAEGIVDPDRVAVMGWSNGGYLTNCLITLKNPPVKIAAASSGAGILDTVAEWGFNDEPAYPIVFKKGLPWEQPEIYRKTSPTYGIGNVKTPTLIHVGGGDERCPPGHSRMLFRALNEYVKVPTELVVYPGEPHGLTKLSNRTAKMEWDLAWFEKHLKAK